MVDRATYKTTFYRINGYFEPMLRQETDVVFFTDLTPDDEGFDDVMWEAMWEQTPAWLLSHGPSTFGFVGWSSVMFDRESIKKIKYIPKPVPSDLTGEGTCESAPLTFHPWLPDDMRDVLRKAYERGKRDAQTKETPND